MEVIRKDHALTKDFDQLPAGASFESMGRVFLKFSDPIQGLDNLWYNAVSVESGLPVHFDAEKRVVFLSKATVVVEGIK